MNKAILYLTLKQQWFNLIDANIKTEEYREIKPYWLSRLLTLEKSKVTKELAEKIYAEILKANAPIQSVLDSYGCRFKTFKGVIFKHGYAAEAPTIAFQEIAFSIGKGNPLWGGGEKEVFILKLPTRVAPEALLLLSLTHQHKFYKLHDNMARCGYCGLEREGKKGEYTYLTKRLSPNSGRYQISHSEIMPPCKAIKQE